MRPPFSGASLREEPRVSVVVDTKDHFSLWMSQKLGPIGSGKSPLATR